MPRKRKLQPLDANSLRPPVRDLFGEVPISRREMMLWMWKVPVWMTRHSSEHRIQSYLRGWNVAYKVARAKLTGALEQILGDEACPHCGVLLEMDYPGRIEALQSVIDAAAVPQIHHQDQQPAIDDPADDAVISDAVTPMPGLVAGQRLPELARIAAGNDSIFEVIKDPALHRTIQPFEAFYRLRREINAPGQVPA